MAKLTLFLAYRSALVNYATPIVGDRAQAEDVVQEAFIRFMQAQGSAMHQPAAYLHRIVRNLALDSVRRRATEQRHQLEPPWWMTPDSPRTPEQELHHRQDLQRLARVLDTLPEQARMALTMHRFQGHTLQEIAQRLDISLSKAHRLVRDALVLLARELAPVEDTPSDTLP